MTNRGVLSSSGGLFLSLFAFATFSPSALAEPPPPPHPREALAFYEGSWAQVGKGADEQQETCSWLPGARGHIVCRTSVKVAGETHASIAYYSYDEPAREYVYHWFGRLGGLYVERGHRIPNGFQFFSEEGTGAGKIRTRFTITEAAEGRVHTVNEKSKVDGPWVVEKTTDYIRTRP
jgi:hypothetical protein